MIDTFIPQFPFSTLNTLCKVGIEWKPNGKKKKKKKENKSPDPNEGRKILKGRRKEQLGTSSPWVLIYGKKAVWCHVRNVCVRLAVGITVPRVTWLYSVCVCVGCLSESKDRGEEEGWTGHFQKSPYSLFVVFFFFVFFFLQLTQTQI